MKRYLWRALSGTQRIAPVFDALKKTKSSALLCGGIGAGIFAADQLLKASMERQPDDSFPRDVPGTNGAARYEKCRNRGFMLGALSEEQEAVKLVPALVTAGLIGRLSAVLRQPGQIFEALGLSMIVSGAGSNLYDRYTRGYVVDYVSIKKGFLRKLVINLGDAAIFSGALLLLLQAAVSALSGLFRKP